MKIRNLRILRILVLILIANLSYSSAVAQDSFFKTTYQSAIDSIKSHCVYAFSIWQKRSPEKEKEAYAIAKMLLLQSQAPWLPPESKLGINSQQAIRILSEINPEKLDFGSMKRVGMNRLFYMKELKSGLGVYLKETFKRVEMGETRPATIRNQVRFEAVGFALDRYFRFSISPPAYQLSRDLVAILEIPGTVPRDYKKIRNDSKYFRQIAWISVLDSSLFNSDRKFENNILESGESQLVAHDFDRSSPEGGHIPWALESRLWLRKIKFEFPGKKAAFYDVPMLLEPQYFEQLLSLTPEKFTEIIGEVGVSLSPSESTTIVGAVQLLGEIFKARWVKAGF